MLGEYGFHFDDLIYRASALEDFYCDQGAYVHVAELGGRGRGRGNGQSGRPRKQGHRKDLRYPIDKTEYDFHLDIVEDE